MIDDKWMRLIKKIVRTHLFDENYRIFIFGSRAKGNNRRWSDIDIGISGPTKVPWAILAQIEADLEDSDLPFRVDVVDFNAAAEEFAKIARKKIVPL